ncbi:peptide-methionine (S)-S-oxide reductase [Micromonospora sp. DT47]|uniref:peptide-methionine (S)-S-oxide reductase n=1 Tax=Micromonospora sp. DT47 TaxID=3393431 RepID=UPI003CF43994
MVTEVSPAGPFWEAEPEHQDYLERYPAGYTCHYVRPNWKLPRRRENASWCSSPGGRLSQSPTGTPGVDAAPGGVRVHDSRGPGPARSGRPCGIARMARDPGKGVLGSARRGGVPLSNWHKPGQRPHPRCPSRDRSRACRSSR